MRIFLHFYRLKPVSTWMELNWWANSSKNITWRSSKGQTNLQRINGPPPQKVLHTKSLNEKFCVYFSHPNILCLNSFGLLTAVRIHSPTTEKSRPQIKFQALQDLLDKYGILYAEHIISTFWKKWKGTRKANGCRMDVCVCACVCVGVDGRPFAIQST